MQERCSSKRSASSEAICELNYSGLLIWWVISISWSIAFLIAVSFYLYARRKKTAEDSVRGRLGDFVFVFVLLGLLALYIVSINRASSVIFALGNIVVEVVLVFYTMRNRK